MLLYNLQFKFTEIMYGGTGYINCFIQYVLSLSKLPYFNSTLRS